MTKQTMSVEEGILNARKMAQAGNVPGAKKLLNAILKQFPNLEAARQELKQVDSLATARDPDDLDVKRIMHLIAAKQFDEANVFLAKMVKDYPRSHHPYFMKGEVHRQKKEHRQAAVCFMQSGKLKPDHMPSHSFAAAALIELGKYEQALVALDIMLKLDPRNISAMQSRAQSLFELKRTDEAIELLDQVRRMKPDDGPTLRELAKIFRIAGDLKRSEELYRRSIDLQPNRIGGYSGLVTVTDLADGDPIVERIEGLLKSGGGEAESRGGLFFTLGKIKEKSKDYPLSGEYYIKGNAVRRASFEYSVDTDIELLNDLGHAFGRKTVARANVPADPSTRMIFVVGMPRSGTTLTEQIIASHPLVFGAGELEYLSRLAHKLMSRTRNGVAIDALSDENLNGALATLATEYMSEVKTLAEGVGIVTDKMPLNFRFIGLIKCMFPDAKIVHCVRDARDNCLSIFRNNFRGTGNGYASDMIELATYHNAYHKMMQHWHEEFPGEIYDSDYHRLTVNQEEESRKLIDYCGLEWDEACLDFHKTKREIRTASATQVRQPMYQSSNKAWEGFRDVLAPMFDLLDH